MITSCEIIEKRSWEIRQPKNIIRVLNNLPHFKDTFLYTIDKNVLSGLESFTLQEAIDILSAYSVSHRRVKFVLDPLTSSICKNASELEPMQISSILYAFAELNYMNLEILQNILPSLLSKISSIENSFIIGSIFTSIGKLRWLNPDLLNALCEWVSSNIETCRTRDLMSMVVTLGNLNYVPNNSEVLRQKLDQVEIHTDNKFILINYIWALSVIGWVTNDQLQLILNEGFSKSVLENLKNKKVLEKLQNINTLARSLPSYNGPYLTTKIFSSSQSKTKKMDLKDSVIDCLKMTYPTPLYMNTQTENTIGINIVSEIIVNDKLKALPLKDISTEFSNEDIVKKSSNDLHNILIFAWNFQDYTIDNNQLQGFNKIALSILRSKGYVCVEIPYFEFEENEKMTDKIKYISTKIKNQLSSD